MFNVSIKLNGTVADVNIEEDGGTGEYRIDDLARLAGMTVRNVRAYQDRGLLPPSRRQGRVALYSDLHLARLRVITPLLERGYTISNIRELLDAWESGQNVGDVLGLEAALAEPWSNEIPTTMTAEELASLYGNDVTDQDAVESALALGVIETSGDEFLVRQPRLLHVGAQLVAAGVPLPAVLALGARLRSDIDRVAEGFVELVATHIFDPVGDFIPPDDLPRLTEIVRRLRPLAQEAVDAELAEAMGRQVQTKLRDRLNRMFEEIRRTQTEAS